uniref:Reverse transcriptase domain-containing protein n=1 Tax=Tanacetum cinerariifolium TaxID=118510 RepID=A0A699GK33_TANCI|nr:reverse transcriptase domain-containing protein [Tanacetum cinerariifolium]
MIEKIRPMKPKQRKNRLLLNQLNPINHRSMHTNQNSITSICLCKEKMEECYAKFIDMIKEVRINVLLVDILARMPNYGKFLKDLVSNKSKMEQLSAAFLNEECSDIIQNKLPPKIGVAENMLVQVERFVFPLDFVILEMKEDNKVHLILGRLFLHTADAIIRVKSKELNLRIEADDQAIQTILLGLLEDIYAAVDSYETAQEIWLRVQQMMKGSDIGIQEKKAKLFNEWERFTSNEGESIESICHTIKLCDQNPYMVT